MALTFDEALLLASRTELEAHTPPPGRPGEVDDASQHVITDEKEEE
jgi:hypothetical protein